MPARAGRRNFFQKTYDLILWYVPILNHLPRDHRFQIGDRVVAGLYTLLEELLVARYMKEKLARLEPLNGRLDVLRYQTRLLKDLGLVAPQRYEHAARQLVSIGTSLGGWIRQQRRLGPS